MVLRLPLIIDSVSKLISHMSTGSKRLRRSPSFLAGGGVLHVHIERIKELKNWMRSLRSLVDKTLDRANRLPEVATAIIFRNGEAPRMEVEEPGAVEDVGCIRDRRPEVAVRTNIVERSSTAVAGAGEKDAG